MNNGRIVRVEFQVEIPCEATDAQIEAWVEFELMANCSLDGKNPLSKHDLRAEPFSVAIR